MTTKNNIVIAATSFVDRLLCPQLTELTYVSSCSTPKTADDIQELLIQARAFNRSHAITGMLLYDGKYFAQRIEGDKTIILNLFDKIKADDRHKDVVLLSTGLIKRRKFQTWGMLYKSTQTQSSTDDFSVKINNLLTNKVN